MKAARCACRSSSPRSRRPLSALAPKAARSSSPRAGASPRASRPSSPRRTQPGAGRVGLDLIVLAPLTAEDWPAAARVYEAGIAAGNATFEPEAPPWDEWTRRRADYPAVVARDSAGEVLGGAGFTPVSPRAVYRGVGAVSIYVAPEHTRRGVGRALLEALAAASEQAGVWALGGGSFPGHGGGRARRRPSGRGSGRWRRASPPRTQRAWRCTRAAASGWWGCASGSGRCPTGAGATCCSTSGAARPWGASSSSPLTVPAGP